MVIPREMIGEEEVSEYTTDGAARVESVGDIGESFGRTAPGILTSDSDMISPGSIIS